MVSSSTVTGNSMQSGNAVKVVVGLSGGVDSSVAAYLLKQQGYQVEALFMRNWHDETGLKSGGCSYEDDVLIARLVARRLDIPFTEIDLSSEYREKVVEYLFAEYKRGRTPNPDVLCNREIKFDSFLTAALDMGADFVATGHYCRKLTVEESGVQRYRLLAGQDANKDQSYFLCQLSQEQLGKALFPLGELTKPEVRRIAEEQKFASAGKKDSQGICFVGKVDLPTFLQQKLAARRGDILEIAAEDAAQCPEAYPGWGYRFQPEAGRKIGEHNGAQFFTVGQRRGLNAGGSPEPRYVLGTDVEKNIVYVGRGHDHPLLLRSVLYIARRELHWVRPDRAPASGEERNYRVRIRYRQPLQDAIMKFSDDGVHIHFSMPQRAITSGQFAVWYDGEELLGSGVIS